MNRKRLELSVPWPNASPTWSTLSRHVKIWLPSRGSVLFTILVVGSLLWAQSAGALTLGAPAAATVSTGTIAYQGRLADTGGNPLTGTYNMIFRLYNAASGGTPLWEEQWTGSSSVQVSDGLFNVMLGSLTPIPQAVITGNNNLFLGITVGTDSEMSPRVQLGSVPFAVQALTVPDGSITKAKLASDVSLVPPDDSVTHPKLALPTGSVCLGSESSVAVGANWARAQIPNMALTFSLDAPGSLLVWSSGLYHFGSNTHMGASIYLDSNEVGVAMEMYPGSGWSDYSMMKLLPIAAGSHTLDLRTFAQQTGTMVFSGGGGGRTCLEYIVVS